jgi:hypothetical protein
MYLQTCKSTDIRVYCIKSKLSVSFKAVKDDCLSNKLTYFSQDNCSPKHVRLSNLVSMNEFICVTHVGHFFWKWNTSRSFYDYMYTVERLHFKFPRFNVLCHSSFRCVEKVKNSKETSFVFVISQMGAICFAQLSTFAWLLKLFRREILFFGVIQQKVISLPRSLRETAVPCILAFSITPPQNLFHH